MSREKKQKQINTKQIKRKREERVWVDGLRTDEYIYIYTTRNRPFHSFLLFECSVVVVLSATEKGWNVASDE